MRKYYKNFKNTIFIGVVVIPNNIILFQRAAFYIITANGVKTGTPAAPNDRHALITEEVVFLSNWMLVQVSLLPAEGPVATT